MQPWRLTRRSVHSAGRCSCWSNGVFPSDGRHANGEWKTTKPDTDNLDKALKDEMTRLRFWHDDAQVASEISEKFWADVPGIFVKVVAL